MLCYFGFFQTQHRFLNKKHLLLYISSFNICMLIPLKIPFRRLITWEGKGNFKCNFNSNTFINYSNLVINNQMTVFKPNTFCY